MSNIAILSVNHQLASVDVREKVAFAANDLTDALNKLKSIDKISACAILSTCNRSEIVVVSDSKNAKKFLVII
jgi:glutamyl-tRNA reductase (EC 1.2.1.70)